MHSALQTRADATLHAHTAAIRIAISRRYQNVRGNGHETGRAQVSLPIRVPYHICRNVSLRLRGSFRPACNTLRLHVMVIATVASIHPNSLLSIHVRLPL